MLYHGTLRRNLSSIMEKGLLPQKGEWAGSYYKDASDLVYAIGRDRRGLLLPIITAQIARAGLVEWSEDYRFDQYKEDFASHGAIVLVKTTAPFRICVEHGNPPGAEQGDWYSTEPITIEHVEKTVVGSKLFNWINLSNEEFVYRLRGIIRNWYRSPKEMA
jgi:hypothetical protein